MAKKRRRSKAAATSKVNMTRAEARAYVARWKRVNEFVAAERRAMTPAEKLRELSELTQMAEQFNWCRAPDDDDRLIWERWNKLRDARRG